MDYLKPGEVAISRARFRELMRAEDKICCLDAAGVDNWDGYDDAMAPIRARMELEERRQAFMDDLLSELGSGAYEPSERGAGVAFHDDAIDKAYGVLETYGVTFKHDDAIEKAFGVIETYGDTFKTKET